MNMDEKTIGISDLAVYVPPLELDLQTLVAERVKSDPRLARHLDRALRVTGQRAIRFPSPWEDTSTMAANAAYDLLRANPQADLAALRYLSVGTETTVDHSKPVSAYVQGMLQRAGMPVPSSLTGFQVQHACASGTLSLLSVAGLLAMSPGERESGLVIASDIARYQPRTTAEVTQGAGAAALLVQRSPRLLELEPGMAGYCSQDVDDFFRPVGSMSAQVKGSYSMECYLNTLEEAFLDHSRRRGLAPREILASTDLFVLHAPFRNMPELAMERLLARHLDLSAQGARDFLEQRGFYRGVDPLGDIGNTYSASLYLFLAHLLADRYREWGQSIVGRRILLASYGSGNTMIVLSGRVAAEAPQVISNWNLSGIRASRLPAGLREYGIWSTGSYMRNSTGLSIQDPILPPGHFYLSGIRQDGYREYRPAADYRECSVPSAAPAAPAELLQSVRVSN
jgi:hydroxymethylglutaryl-CoA synthase